MAQQLGDYIRQIRSEKGITLRKLKELSGISNSYLSQLENSATGSDGKIISPTLETLLSIANGLGVPLEKILTATGHIKANITFEEPAQQNSHLSGIGIFIRKKREEKSLSLRGFAQMCGLSHSYIDNIEKGYDQRTKKPISPTLDALIKISAGLNISLSNFLESTGYIENRPTQPVDLKLYLDQILSAIGRIENKFTEKYRALPLDAQQRINNQLNFEYEQSRKD